MGNILVYFPTNNHVGWANYARGFRATYNSIYSVRLIFIFKINFELIQLKNRFRREFFSHKNFRMHCANLSSRLESFSRGLFIKPPLLHCLYNVRFLWLLFLWFDPWRLVSGLVTSLVLQLSRSFLLRWKSRVFLAEFSRTIRTMAAPCRGNGDFSQ